MNVIGTAIDQKPTGEDGNHLDGCRTAMWKERRNHHIVISKQQLKLLIWNTGHKRSRETPGSGYQANIVVDLRETHSEIVDRIRVSQDQWRAVAGAEVKQD